MTLGRDARRRLALYGGGAAVVALVFLLPTLVVKLGPRTKVKTFDYEAAERHEASRLLVEYVRIDTSNPPGRTVEAAAFWKRLFECEGIPHEVFGDDPQRPIVVARLPGRQRGEALCLLHHMDVYAPGDLSKWRQPPFAARMGEAEDRPYLYGRGTIDMKNIGVASFWAMAELKREGIVPERDIVFVGEPAEESFQPERGVGWLVEHRPDLLEGVTDFFNEGGVNEVLASDIERFGVEVLQKGTWGITVLSPAREPLDELRRFLAERDREAPYRLVPEVVEFLRFVGPSRGDMWGRLVLYPQRLFDQRDPRLALMPEVYRSLVKDLVYAGDPAAGAAGGWEMNVVATCLPGSSVEAGFRRMEEWLAERKLEHRTRFMSKDSRPTPREGRAWEALVRALELDPERAQVGTYVLSGSYTNSSYLRDKGYRAFGVSAFNITIYDAAKAHNDNERILLPDFVEGAERTLRILREFATAP